jgi:putative Holliday junction resolvase
VSVICLDFGERRIGVAASDPLGVLAQPVTVIERKSLAEDIARIGAIAEQRRAERIVLGLPLNMDGTVGPQARRARRFAARLKRDLGLEIVLWDERLSTIEADLVGQELAPTPQERARRRRRRDAIAAAVILQDYLEAQRGSEQA